MADVLFVAPDLAPGGVGRCVTFIVDALPQEGLETGLFLLRRFNGEYKIRNAPVTHALPAMPAAWRFRSALPLAFWRLLIHLRNEPPALVCSHGLLCNTLVAVASMLSMRKYATVAVEHNSPWAHYSGSPLQRLKRWLAHFSYSRHDVVVGVSKGVVRDLSTMFPSLAGKFRHVYNGIPVDEVRRLASCAPSTPLQPGVLQFVSIGRLDALKDFKTLVDAAEILDDPRIAFTIFGDGPERKTLQQRIAASSSRSKVTLAGHVSNPFPALARAYAFISTSRRESFGNAMVEALSLGVPVIAADCPHGPAEILANGRYGVLFPVGDATALAAAIRRLIDHRQEHDRLALVAPGRAAAFSLEQHRRNVAALFNPLL
ncbi:glycosyl transferase [Pigmentiphaga sp. NML080357]|uniref:glycosyltransferase n=1 Tax=Pigmentiphaga sp. NML080357 TaxID=2008675 RepID=UPI000B40A8BD|nr:glycosyltransferase [Pigmentiphaga sp. NML080357]OVZ58494.1 glycosyl transferase [Pigmentiphaga sp. NML080357]